MVSRGADGRENMLRTGVCHRSIASSIIGASQITLHGN